MVNLKNIIKLSLVASVALSTSLYAEDYYDFRGHDNHESAPEKESVDISHSIIQNIYSTKYKKRGAKKEKKEKEQSASSFSSIIIMDSERSSMEQGNADITSSAFKLSYDKDFTNESDIGALFSYRTTDEETTNRKSQEFLLSPYYKYYKDIKENIDVELVGNFLVGTRKFDDSTSSYNTYGIGVTAIGGYYIGEDIILNIPLGLQSVKRSGSGDDDIQNFLNFGFSGEYKIKESWFVNANILQTKDLDSDSKIKATYYVLQSTYYGELWNFGVGYKTVKNVSNYKEDTFMLSAQYNW